MDAETRERMIGQVQDLHQDASRAAETDPTKARKLLETAAELLEAMQEKGAKPRPSLVKSVRDALQTLDDNLFAKGTPANKLPDEIEKKMKKAGLPTGGSMPFIPKLDKNKKGEPVIRKQTILHGPKKGKKGYVDSNGKIWIRDRAHGKYPDHWDVQENDGKKGRT